MDSLHHHDLRPFAHTHAFADAGMQRRERALSQVTLITVVTMLAELLAGWWSGSLALTADGWHMGTHALALGGAVLAYRLSARASAHRSGSGSGTGYAFGGWKIEVLTAYTSGLALLAVAIGLTIESISVLRSPRPIEYGEAMAIAALGLAVNIASAWLLSRGTSGTASATADEHGHHDHDHPAHDAPHDHSHHGHHHHDHNFKAAYVHVLADAITSVLAIVALAGGLWFGLSWLDPVVALLGAVVIAQWSFSVLRSSARALVDATEDPALAQRIRELIEADGDAKLSDLHVWQVGAQAWSAVVSIVADHPHSAAHYRERLHAMPALRHVTVEVHRCEGAHANASARHHDAHP